MEIGPSVREEKGDSEAWPRLLSLIVASGVPL